MVDSKRRSHPGPFQDLAGRVFGRLKVISYWGSTSSGAAWNCVCECGTVRIVRTFQLTTGKSKSCGCLQREVAARPRAGKYKRRGPEYCTWRHMIARCNDPKERGYERYGAVGITVCDRWLSFEAFMADMGLKPSPEHTIDRIENSKGYEPGNCRWATFAQQMANRRKRRKSKQ